jgi:hypothetical protein
MKTKAETNEIVIKGTIQRINEIRVDSLKR